MVTGNMRRRMGTPEGVNFVYNKQKDRVLRGPGYASPVKFWVPVKGSIGIHDASWRKEFGRGHLPDCRFPWLYQYTEGQNGRIVRHGTDRYPCRNVLLIKQTFSDKMCAGCEHFENNLTM